VNEIPCASQPPHTLKLFWQLPSTLQSQRSWSTLVQWLFQAPETGNKSDTVFFRTWSSLPHGFQDTPIQLRYAASRFLVDAFHLVRFLMELEDAFSWFIMFAFSDACANLPWRIYNCKSDLLDTQHQCWCTIYLTLDVVHLKEYPWYSWIDHQGLTHHLCWSWQILFAA